MDILHFNDEEFSRYQFPKGQLTLVDFWATWCAPCMVLSPLIDELAESFKDQIQFIKVDVTKDNAYNAVQWPHPVIPAIVMLDGDRVLGYISEIGEHFGDLAPSPRGVLDLSFIEPVVLNKSRLLQFIHNFLPNNEGLQQTNYLKFNKSFIAKDSWTLVNFYQSGYFLFLEEFQSAIQNIAEKYAQQIRIISVDFEHDNGKFARVWQLERPPTIKLYHDQQFLGQLSPNGLKDQTLNFLEAGVDELFSSNAKHTKDDSLKFVQDQLEQFLQTHLEK